VPSSDLYSGEIEAQSCFSVFPLVILIPCLFGVRFSCNDVWCRASSVEGVTGGFVDWKL